MVVTPIPVHLVHTVFQYILPPSLPIPAHLLSRPLIERHHFLSVSPTDSGSYLCWPSSYTNQVTEALEGESQSALTHEPEHDVRYSAPDAETLLAHVRPHDKSPLQIIFVWDEVTETWRYHDARLLPFPHSAYSSLDDALTNRPKAISGLHLSLADAEEALGETSSSSPANDNYWAGYDSSGSSPSSPTVPVGITAEEEDKAEAAYWASYSAVHGSGDSTVPSPMLEKGRLARYQKQSDLRGPDIPMDPLVTNLHLKLHGRQNDLLSPRFNPSQYERPDSPDEADAQVDAGSSLSGSTRGQMTDDYGFPIVTDLKTVEPNTSGMSCDHNVCIAETPAAAEKHGGDGEEDAAVKETVRGIYRMWKGDSQSANAGAFLDVVKSALEGL